MIRTGLLIMLLGLAIAVGGTFLYAYVLAPNDESTAGAQVLMWISWGIGASLLIGGGVEAVSGVMYTKKPSLTKD